MTVYIKLESFFFGSDRLAARDGKLRLRRSQRSPHPARPFKKHWHVNFVRDISNIIPAKIPNSTPLHRPITEMGCSYWRGLQSEDRVAVTGEGCSLRTGLQLLERAAV